MCPFDSIVSLGFQVDSLAFGQLWKFLLLFSGAVLSIRLFFTIIVSVTLICNKNWDRLKRLTRL